MTTTTGPRVVAVGGGHGLAATLRAARTYAGDLTAIVSVADDGGSSGRLRADAQRPAPGDLRKCLVALAGEPSILSRAMEYRFGSGDLAGHAFGNLLIAALDESEGDLVTALDEVGRLIGAVGRVLPTTTIPVELVAEVAAGDDVAGQVAVMAREDVESVRLEPANVPACPDAIVALSKAEQVVLGPGSLFTSVLAATAVDEVREAVSASPGRLVYVCNLHPQPPETTGFGVSDHVDALLNHGVKPEVVLYDPSTIGGADGVTGVVAVPLARTSGLAHDPAKLGAALAALV